MANDNDATQIKIHFFFLHTPHRRLDHLKLFKEVDPSREEDDVIKYYY